MVVDDFLSALDMEQCEVAQNTRGALCVRAGAGTGKTRAITYRIAQAVRTGVVRPQQILAVTFTKRAAGEMRSRLRNLGVYGVQARTFHSAALSQLRYFWPQAIGGRVPEIKESKAVFVSSAAAQLGMSNDSVTVRDLSAEIEWAKVSLIAPEDYPARAREAGRIGVANQTPEEIAQVIKLYEQLKTERAVIDFEDVILILIGILLDRPDIARAIRDQYTYFVVDEYQDVSPMQYRLLQLWLGGRKDICVVGDPAQTIFTFTGATSAYLENFSREFRGCAEVTLDRNYRSTPEIIALANTIVRSGTGVESIRLRAMNAEGSPVHFSVFSHGTQEAEGVARRIAHVRAQGVRLDRIAVLYRTNSQSQEFERALQESGIPYVLQGQESFFRRKEIREAMVALRVQARDTEHGKGLPDDLPDVVDKVLRSMGWRPEGPSIQGASRERWESLDTLRILAAELWEARRAGIREFVAELEERNADQNTPSTNAVVLSSLHAAKGLEWDIVFLVGLAQGVLPINYATEKTDIEEEKRLLYVGITRARSELYMSYAQAYGNRQGNKISQFLEEVWPKDQSRSTRARHRLAREAKQFEHEEAHVQEVFECLVSWRMGKAGELNKPAHFIFTDSALRSIVREMPKNLAELGKIRGIGTLKLTSYGLDILHILDKFRGSIGN